MTPSCGGSSRRRAPTATSGGTWRASPATLSGLLEPEDIEEPDPWVDAIFDERYRILKRLAQGSMGAVYRGERVPLGRVVAVKILHQSFVQDPEFVGRFEREIRVMSKLAHPNCVSVIDLGATPTPYVVMDFIDGRTLQEMLEDGALPVARAIDIIRQVLAGLAHAHAQNIVHRDIKPANVMVTQEIGKGDHARILDFGLAMLRSGASVVATQTHIVVGTPAYMSPEQTLGSKVGPASDLYSTGCVLFELLTGGKPFEADDTFELLGKHRAAPLPRLHDAAPGTRFPVGLQSVLDTAMAKEPNARFASAIEFADALAQIAVAGDVSAPPTRPSTPPPVRASGSGPAASIADNADTVQDQPRLDRDEPNWHDKVGGRRGLGLFGALLLVAGAAVLTWKVSARWHETEDQAAGPVAALPGAGVDAGAGAGAAAAAAPLPLLADAAAPLVVTPVDASPPDAVPEPPDAAEPDAAAGAPDPVAAEVERDAGAPAPLPTPDQQPAPEPELKDEASPPPAPAPVGPPAVAPITNLNQALAAAKAGRREAAITALHGFWKKDPRSPWYPYYLGNLYYEKGWWGTGIDHYRAAIAKRASLKSSERIIANCIRALAFTKSRSKAIGLLKTIGKKAVPALKRAAKNDRNANVRKYAAYLARTIRR